jgi:hypothetical protein
MGNIHVGWLFNLPGSKDKEFEFELVLIFSRVPVTARRIQWTEINLDFKDSITLHTSKYTYGAYTTCPNHHFPVCRVFSEVVTVSIHTQTLSRNFLCRWQPNTSVLSIFGQSWRPSNRFLFSFLFILLVLLLLCNEDYLPIPPQRTCEHTACHQPPSLQECLYATMVSSDVADW